MKFLIYILVLFFVSNSYAHFKKPPLNFHVTFVKGSKWDDKKDYYKQAHIWKHIDLMRKLYHKDKIVYASRDEKSGLEFIVFKGFKSEKDLKSVVLDNKAIKLKTLDYEIQEVSTHMKEKKANVSKKHKH